MSSSVEIPRLFTSVEVVQRIDCLLLFLKHCSKVSILLVVTFVKVNFWLQDYLKFSDMALPFAFFLTSGIVA